MIWRLLINTVERVNKRILRYNFVWPVSGCSLSNWPIKSTRLTSYVSRQLHLDAIDLNSYDHRNTRANHFNEILEVFNYHRFGSANTQKQLIEYLIELALENDDSIYQ